MSGFSIMDIQPFFRVFASQTNTCPCPIEAPHQENKMNTVTVATNTPDFRHERSALRDALYYAERDHDRKLKKHFKLADDEHKTVKAKLDAIKAGKYVVIDEKKIDDEEYGEWRWIESAIRFRDPEVKEDKAGYRKAHEVMNAEAERIRTDIVVLPPEKALETLRKFESKTFH